MVEVVSALSVTEPLGWEGSSGDPPVQPLVPSRRSWGRLLRAMASQVLDICRAGHSTTPLVNLFQCLSKPPGVTLLHAFFLVPLKRMMVSLPHVIRTAWS